MATDQPGHPFAEEPFDQRPAVDVVRGLEAQRPTARIPFEPPEIVHEPGDLQLDVVGTRGAEQVGALQRVLEDRQATFVVRVA